MIRGLYRKISSEKTINCLIFAITVWYLGLCVLHYFYQRPLWNDEQAVFSSLLWLKPSDFFTGELVNGQNFPRLHLFIVQKIARAFDFSLLSVRFLSFVFMLTAFFVWRRIFSLEFKDRKQFLAYLLSWCSSAALIYYSAELKQYSMDVLSSSLFVLFLYNQERLRRENNRLYETFLFLLPALILFSYPSFFFFIFPLHNMVVMHKREGGGARHIAIYLSSLAVFCAIGYFFDMRLRKVCNYDDYFIYFTSAGDFFRTLGEGIMNLFSRYLVERPRILKKILVFFFVFGLFNTFGSFFAFFKKENYYFRSVKTIALIVFLELVFMGALKKYPFTVPRTSLFFSPIILFLTLNGIIALKRFNVYLYRAVYYPYLVLLLFIFIQLSVLCATGRGQFAPQLWFFGIKS
ncbi:MAG: hypothetical protein HQL27_03875 [Candidatus Omnitrophica bacterium]|nr:hypothetical protein [Candidatus Omnitrophota bacterium]